MNISVFDLFSIGIGPSSSHTVGPMKAAWDFIHSLDPHQRVERIKITLHGSLAHTGQGHLTHHAIVMGLEGHLPDRIDPSIIHSRFQCIIQTSTLRCPGRNIAFNFSQDFIFDKDVVFEHHSNAMQFFAYDQQDKIIQQELYYSIGGGFIEKDQGGTPTPPQPTSTTFPFAFDSGESLLSLCQQHNLSIAELMMHNEKQLRSESAIHKGLDEIARVMLNSIASGCNADTPIPGSLQLRRRAPELLASISQFGPPRQGHPHPMNCLNCFAMAASEQNASGGRIVTAPTNGAAGIIPALIQYHLCFDSGANAESVRRFLLTAGAICLLYKFNASISGAEMGCQGEIGVACSIAAAGLTAARMGTLFQIENAAEVGIEHNLGLTCDPVAGLVQIPCIERNAMGAVKAVNAASLALASVERGKVTLDMAIKTMREIGDDMKSIYKETSLGGLAVNVPAC